MIRVLHPDHLGFIVGAKPSGGKHQGLPLHVDAFGMRFVVRPR